MIEYGRKECWMRLRKNEVKECYEFHGCIDEWIDKDENGRDSYFLILLRQNSTFFYRLRIHLFVIYAPYLTNDRSVDSLKYPYSYILSFSTISCSNNIISNNLNDTCGWVLAVILSCKNKEYRSCEHCNLFYYFLGLLLHFCYYVGYMFYLLYLNVYIIQFVVSNL